MRILNLDSYYYDSVDDKKRMSGNGFGKGEPNMRLGIGVNILSIQVMKMYF